MNAAKKEKPRLRRRAALGGVAGAAVTAEATLAGCDAGTPARSPEAVPRGVGTQPPGVAPSAIPEPTPEPTPVPEPQPIIPPGDAHFGVNEGFNAAVHARQLGARWTRWILEWSEVQRYGPGTFNSDDDKNTY